jgi:hypothetical protein
MKVLCICYGGNVRSVALKHLLNKMGHDALAAGILNSPETLSHLHDWAEKVVVTDPVLLASLPFRESPKIIVYDLGDDRWNNPFHKELEALVQKIVVERRDFVFA